MFVFTDLIELLIRFIYKLYLLSFTYPVLFQNGFIIQKQDEVVDGSNQLQQLFEHDHEDS